MQRPTALPIRLFLSALLLVGCAGDAFESTADLPATTTPLAGAAGSAPAGGATGTPAGAAGSPAGAAGQAGAVGPSAGSGGSAAGPSGAGGSAGTSAGGSAAGGTAPAAGQAGSPDAGSGGSGGSGSNEPGGGGSNQAGGAGQGGTGGSAGTAGAEQGGSAGALGCQPEAHEPNDSATMASPACSPAPCAVAAGQGTVGFGGALASVVGHVEAADPDYFRFTGLDTGGAVHPRARVSGLEGGRVCLLLRCQSGAPSQFSCAKGEATLGDGDLDACCSEQGDVEASYACQGASKTANMIVVVTTAAAACQPYQLDVAF